MPERVWLGRVGQLETCRACDVSFSMVAGESTSSLVHRYTDWREAHVACQLPEMDDEEWGPDSAQQQLERGPA